MARFSFNLQPGKLLCFYQDRMQYFDQWKLQSMEPAVYLLRKCASANNSSAKITFSSIPRWLDVDSGGIIYIGSTKNIRKRPCVPSEKYNTWKDGSWAGRVRRVTELKEANTPIIPYSEILIDVRPHADFKEKEDAALLSYIRAFGELPPLNRNSKLESHDM